MRSKRTRMQGTRRRGVSDSSHAAELHYRDPMQPEPTSSTNTTARRSPSTGTASSRVQTAARPVPKSVWLLIQPMALMDTSSNSPEPTNEPTPEKKKNKPMMALCMDLGAAE